MTTSAAVSTAFAAIPAKGAGTLEIALTKGNLLDGRLANLGWNMELPDSMSKLVWDNALVISPALAKELGIDSRVKRNAYLSDVVTIDVGGRTITAPTFVLPGLEKNSAYLNLGFGRKAGVVATGVGVDAYPLVDKDGSMLVVCTITKTGTGPLQPPGQSLQRSHLRGVDDLPGRRQRARARHGV